MYFQNEKCALCTIYNVKCPINYRWKLMHRKAWQFLNGSGDRKGDERCKISRNKLFNNNNLQIGSYHLSRAFLSPNFFLPPSLKVF